MVYKIDIGLYRVCISFLTLKSSEFTIWCTDDKITSRPDRNCGYCTHPSIFNRDGCGSVPSRGNHAAVVQHNGDLGVLLVAGSLRLEGVMVVDVGVVVVVMVVTAVDGVNSE